MEKDANGAALETATFAGGCFWCMEPPFEELKDVSAGYMGGRRKTPLTSR